MAAKKKITRTSDKKKPVSKAKKAPARAKAPPAKKKPAAKGKAPARTSSARKAKKPAARAKAPLKSKRPPVRAKRPAPKKKKVVASAPVVENSHALALARSIGQLALEKKALDVLVIDTRAGAQRVGYDYVVLATGESDRQLEAIASSVDDSLRAKGEKPSNVEAGPDWVLADYGDVVAHFFTPDRRDAVDFEGMWSDAPRVSL
jgi:ribosome-associated protein